MRARNAMFTALIAMLTVPQVGAAADPGADRPSWVVCEPVPTAEEYFFVGMSEPQSSEYAAREDARLHVLKQAADFAGIRVFHATSEDRFRKSEAIEGNVFVDDASVAETVSDLFVRRLKAKEWFLERHSNPDSQRRMWVARLLAAIPRAEIDKAIAAAQSRRDHVATHGQPNAGDAVVCVEESPSPVSSILRAAVEQYLSKFHIPVFDQESTSRPEVPILRLSIDVVQEHTVYDHQFVLARIVCRIQHRLPDGTTVTDGVMTGSKRVYARTLEIATETAVGAFLQDEGRGLIRAVRGW